MFFPPVINAWYPGLDTEKTGYLFLQDLLFHLLLLLRILTGMSAFH